MYNIKLMKILNLYMIIYINGMVISFYVVLVALLLIKLKKVLEMLLKILQN